MKNLEIVNGVLVRCLNQDITDITIPDSVTIIGNGAFADCSSLTNIKIPDSVTIIGKSAFGGCIGLTNIKIPNSVTVIDNWTFDDCIGLTSITIPNSVTSIGGWAFSDCSSLTSITIPDGVTSIGKGAFYGCSSLTSITIPDSVRSIGHCAFYGCNGLKSQIRNYKAFNLKNGNLSCRYTLFSQMKWSNQIDNIELCQRGYHYCTNLFDIFNYYSGEIDGDIAIYECEVGDTTYSKESGDSKHVTNKIKPVKRLYREDIIRILNGQD